MLCFLHIAGTAEIQIAFLEVFVIALRRPFHMSFNAMLTTFALLKRKLTILTLSHTSALVATPLKAYYNIFELAKILNVYSVLKFDR